MKKNTGLFWVWLVVLSVVSCTNNPLGTGSNDNSSPFEHYNPLVLDRNTTNTAVYEQIPIMSQGLSESRHLVGFLMTRNSQVDENEVFRVAQTYIREAAIEGVNHDIGFCQMCLETNYLRYTGDVSSNQNNYCGLGATGGGVPGHTFDNMQIGIRAHIQHLKAYGSTRPLRQGLVDPRFGMVRRGRSLYVPGLTGAWATDPNYSEKIIGIMIKLTEYQMTSSRI
ncbi:MAG: glucosaminidase domain-containing protein [Planctomycetes bacterium]|nr:glucosaminidase domain-containing protein [Planctomycetota bacterium]